MVKIIAFVDQDYPELDELKNGYYNLEVIKAEEENEKAIGLEIKTYPTFVYYYKGQKYLKSEYHEKEIFIEEIKENVKRMKEDLTMRTIRVFGKLTCTTCQKMQPVIMELIDEGFRIETIMEDGNEELFFQEEVGPYPTIKFYENGQFYAKTTGLVSKDEIIRIYNEVL